VNEPQRHTPWTRVHWSEFIAALESFRDHFSTRPDDEPAYLRCYGRLRGKSIFERASRIEDIVRFLNSWECNLAASEALPVLRRWVLGHASELADLAIISVDDRAVPAKQEEVQRLYDSLHRTGSAEITNWSDAATSKLLHQIVPALLVMWDQKIKRCATDYGHFITDMHSLGVRLISESGFDSRLDVERLLQSHLGYPVCKPMAKYLDEYNWYTMVGQHRISMVTPRHRTAGSSPRDPDRRRESVDDGP
jgi:hypothetical protein